MTLSIGVLTFDEAGNMTIHDVGPGRDLAGFEVYREQFWGAQIMLELGLELLPRLRDGIWLWVEQPDLERLEREAEIIIQHSAEISAATLVEEHKVLWYANNLLNAIAIARTVNGIVDIG